MQNKQTKNDAGWRKKKRILVSVLTFFLFYNNL
jgi:hypothetical protein